MSVTQATLLGDTFGSKASGTIPVGGIIMWSGSTASIPTGWALCMTGDSEVLLSDGSTKRIDEIVDNKLQVEVMAFNETTGLIEPRKVVDWFVNESNKNEYIRLKIFRGNSKLGQKRSLDVTRDHPVWVVDRGWVTADKINSGDKVLIHQPTLTNAGHQSILGQWLGDGSIDEMGVFRLSHGKSQEEYISDTTKKLGINLKEHIQAGNGYGVGKKYLRTCLALKTFSPDTYELMMSGRKVRKEVLRELGPIGLAYWYMDDGNLQVDVRSATPTVRAQIHTEGFDEDELQLIIEWFNSSYGINAIPYNRPNTKGRFIRFDYKSTIKFLEMIAPYIHPSMKYKLPENLHSIPYLLEDISFIENKPTEQYVSVVEICNLSPSKRNSSRFHKRYDIKVEGLHSFVANGFIVHNCNGANGTPNLQDRFIVGAGSAYGVGATGGENSVTLTTSQTPNHRHFLASTSGYQGSEGGKSELGQAPTQHISSYGFGGSGDTQEKRDYVLERATGECNVGLSGPPIDSSGNQSFGQAHENRPPYYALAFIMRVS
jgi:microcystin-dependent protein